MGVPHWEMRDPGLVTPIGVTAPAPVYEIRINLPAYRLTLLRDGQAFRTYTVAIGKPATPSVIGRFRVVNRVINPTWFPKGKKPVPPGPDNPVGTRWLGLSVPDYGVHGTNAPASIGQAASGGCLRMLNLAVEDLATFVKPGVPITIDYETIEVGRLNYAANDAGAALPSARRPLWHLVVYPDVYDRRTNTVAAAIAKLRAAGVAAPLDQAALEALLKYSRRQEAAVPTIATVMIDGQPAGGNVWYRGAEAMLASNGEEELALPPAAEGELRVVEEVGGVRYAPAWLIARALGRRVRYVQDADLLTLDTVEVWWDGQPAGFSAAWLEGEFQVPVSKLASLVGSTPPALPESNAEADSNYVDFAGDTYVRPGEAARLLGLELLPPDPSQGDLAPISFRPLRPDVGPPETEGRRD